MTHWWNRPVVIAGCVLIAVCIIFFAARISQSTLGAFIVPLLMIGSFAVGFALAGTQVVAQLRDLRRRVGRFVETGERRSSVSRVGMSTDLGKLYDVFDDLSRITAAGEKQAQQSHQDRDVLIREVHHRVKNNLQLTSSIISLHIQDAPDDATKAVLRQVQDRVKSLGTAHTDIYLGSWSGAVPVARLLAEIADNAEDLGASIDHPIQIDRHIAETFLPPDQVVPLSLLVSEALNAVMRVGRPQDVSLRFAVADDLVVTVRAKRSDTELGLGNITPKFMQVLATQMNGHLSETRNGEQYKLTFTFPNLEPPSKPVA